MIGEYNGDAISDQEWDYAYDQYLDESDYDEDHNDYESDNPLSMAIQGTRDD